jgi:O-acetyl-ADP-ribose deacetylase (regulator of RNase III)
MTNANITVVKGNIVRQTDCDGVVNSANPNLRAGSGVCGAIYAAAGPRLEPYSSQFAPLQISEALATPGFDMACRYIIHTRGPKYYEDADPPGNLEKAMRNTIALADENGLTRLAVPAISMGVYGYPAEEAIPILVRVASEMAGSLKSLLEIRFVVVSDELLHLFRRSIEQQVTAADECSPQALMPLRVSRAKESEVRDKLDRFHVLTYAEDGFSPLDIHARRLGLDRELVKSFASAVNERSSVGSLHPQAPISAVPQELVRDRQNIDALVASIGEFLRVNRETIKARRLAFDFRTPSVPEFTVAALNSAIRTQESGLEEILILEM